VLLTILVCAAAVYRLVVLPVEDEFAAHHMRLASTNAAEQVRRLVRSVENATQNGRAWGQAGLLSIDDPDGMTRLLIPLVTDTPELTSVLFAREDGREILLVKTGQGWSNRITDAVRSP
jgi:two-component system sensor histidine kinase/response regulator